MSAIHLIRRSFVTHYPKFIRTLASSLNNSSPGSQWPGSHCRFNCTRADSNLDTSPGPVATKDAESSEVEIYKSLLNQVTATTVSDNAHAVEIGVKNAGSFLDQIEEAGIFIKPKLPARVESLTPFVNDSETLANLLKLGVDLHRVEKNTEVATFLVKANFETDVKPFIQFLHDLGVSGEDFGRCFTKNPSIFTETLDNLNVRVNYFESKNFSQDSIAHIVVRCPEVLSQATKETDAKLGYLQKSYGLTGDEVRLVATRLPKILVWSKKRLQENKFYMKDFLRFGASELKDIMVNCPKLYLTNTDALQERFTYLHDVMGLSHADVLKFPNVLRSRKFIIKQRHLFLEHIGRNQYDPAKENYVSLKALVSGKDQDFCEKVAKVPVQQFNSFLKTL